MNLLQYLQKKYNTDKPTSIMACEARVFSIPYPLRPNWLATFGHIEITDDLQEQLIASLQKKKALRSAVGLAVFGVEPLSTGVTRELRAQHRSMSKKARKAAMNAHRVTLLEDKMATGNNWGSAPPAYQPKIQPPAQSIKTPSQRSHKVKFRIDPNSEEFLQSYEWRSLRMEVLAKYGPICMCCGATRADGEKIHVDHIKPRRKRPDLALIFDNLQVLCGTCNHGKGNWNDTDWRPKESDAQQDEFDANARAHLRLITKD